MRLSAHGRDQAGWTLNVSRGGVRLVIEEPVIVGESYLVTVGEGPSRPATVVWTREEADGQIAGLRFTDIDNGEVPPAAMPNSA